MIHGNIERECVLFDKALMVGNLPFGLMLFDRKSFATSRTKLVASTEKRGISWRRGWAQIGTGRQINKL
jgi:hypothetical protein